MKTFEQLDSTQQEKAIQKCTVRLLEAILEGGIRFNDQLNQDDLQARIDRAMAQAEKMKTPWFASEYVMETCKDEIEGMARCDAEDALYSEGENVIAGIIAPAKVPANLAAAA